MVYLVDPGEEGHAAAEDRGADAGDVDEGALETGGEINTGT